jgi:hypothetical protein
MKRDVVARAVVVARVREFFHLSGSASPWLARAVVWLLCAVVVGVPLAAHSPGAVDAGPVLPSPLEPSVPLQEWATDGGVRSITLASALQSIPDKVIDGQKPADACDPDLGERPINGGCWMLTEVKRPCPPGKLYEHEGQCWRPIPRRARVPTSGDVYPVNLANP